MTLLSNRSLRQKVVLVFLAPTLLTVMFYGVAAYGVVRSGLEEELGKRLVAVGQAVAADFSRGIVASQLTRLDATKVRTLDRLREDLEAVRQDTGARRLFLFDEHMRSLVDTDPDIEFGSKLYGLEADRFEIERAFANATPTTSVLFTDEDGTRYKMAYVPILDREGSGEVVAALGVEASASYFALLTNFASGLVVLGLLGLILVAAVGYLFARRLTEPLNHLVTAARRLEGGDLTEPVTHLQDEPIETGDEIERLSRSFEEMRRAILSRDRRMQMMLSGIAHEVRNPLGGMELFCGLLEEDLQDEDPVDADKLEKVARIQRELGYLNKVVTDFLDFARHRPLEMERFDVGDLLHEIALLMAGEIDDATCALSVEVESPGLEVTADRQRIRRAVINAVRNAYQASEGGGPITLAARAPAEDVRVITIADEGPGIPDETLAQILEPFFTTKEKGSGLGLALIAQIVEQHGGEMLIDSEVGEGTRVTFRLPFDEDVEMSAPQTAEIPEGWLG